jgi:hypothetical protein
MDGMTSPCWMLRPKVEKPGRGRNVCEFGHKHYFSSEIAPAGMKAPLTLQQIHQKEVRSHM